uniref:BAR/IMD domain containing adaptor protein 2 n=1 Tax=Panthera tigris altaica TaxID=74533 RepID=A0A8C9JVJ9_PANTA
HPLSFAEQTHRDHVTIMEQFNPSLRNFIAMGKNYEKALAGVTYAAKGYFDALVKMGELASESQGSKELGDVLFQMAEVHRQIQNQLEEMVRPPGWEGQGQEGRWADGQGQAAEPDPVPSPHALSCPPQYIDAISNKQGELENYVSDGYKTALTEERRRFCFLVEKQCAVAKNSAAYHSKVGLLAAQGQGPRGLKWTGSLADIGGLAGSAHRGHFPASSSLPHRRPLPPRHRPEVGGRESAPVMNGISGPDGEDYSPWADRKAAQPKASSPPQSQSKLSDSYSNTLPVRKSVTPKNSYAASKGGEGLQNPGHRNGRMRVKAIFSHAAGDNSTLLSFKEGDLITLLVPEARDGWHYGESEKTKIRVSPDVSPPPGQPHHLGRGQRGTGKSVGSLSPGHGTHLPPPDSFSGGPSVPLATGSALTPSLTCVPVSPQGLDDYGARAVSRNPFANVQLKPTVTNDRSAWDRGRGRGRHRLRGTDLF